jgi:hypothetical protein
MSSLICLGHVILPIPATQLSLLMVFLLSITCLEIFLGHLQTVVTVKHHCYEFSHHTLYKNMRPMLISIIQLETM